MGDDVAVLDADLGKLIGLTGGGRLYLMPAAPFARQVSLGPALTDVRGEQRDGWLMLDLGGVRTVRALPYFGELQFAYTLDATASDAQVLQAMQQGFGGMYDVYDQYLATL